MVCFFHQPYWIARLETENGFPSEGRYIFDKPQTRVEWDAEFTISVSLNEVSDWQLLRVLNPAF